MSIANLNRGPLLFPEEGTGGGGTGDPAPAAAAPAATPPAPPAVPPAVPPAAAQPPAQPPAPTESPATPPAEPPAPITMTSAQLNERLERERSSFLREQGFESPEQLAEMRTRDTAAQAAAEQARQAQLTNEQRLTEDVATRTAERDAAQAESDRLRFEGHVSGHCAAQGVRNVSYAQFAIERAANALPEGEELDVEAWLTERMNPENAEHADMRNALGVPDAPPATTPTPATTTPGGGPPPPAPPPAGGNPPPDGDAFAMSAADWQQRQERLGLG